MADVMQPGSAWMDLSVAGAWCSAFRYTVDLAQTAGPAFVPEAFDAQGVAMSTVLSFYLAVEHARNVIRRAPWITERPMDGTTLDSLHRRAAQFRDAYMHLDDKADREYVFPPAPPPERGSRPGPRVAVPLGFGFDDAGPWLYAPIGYTTTRVITRLSWAEMQMAIDAIESWVLDLLARSNGFQPKWVAYLEAQRAGAST